MPSAAKEDRSPADPWEPMNRQISAFNETVDGLTFKPLAKGYEQVIPQVVRRGINNFSRNLIGPLNILNNLLQGKVQRGASETGRFFVNTTFGIGGLFNVGNALGFDVYREDFGQTLAVWGVADGPYVIVPILGPRTLRDAAMIPLNFAADPTFYIKDDSTRLGTNRGFLRSLSRDPRSIPAESAIPDLRRGSTCRRRLLRRLRELRRGLLIG